MKLLMNIGEDPEFRAFIAKIWANHPNNKEGEE